MTLKSIPFAPLVIAATLVAFAIMGILPAQVMGRASAAESTFDVTGQFVDGSILSGTLTIDTAAGVVTTIDLSIAGRLNDNFNALNDSQSGNPGLGYYQILVRDSNGDVLGLAIPSTDGGATLTGYVGGPLFSESNPWVPFTPLSSVSESGAPLLDNLSTGELVATPEPRAYASRSCCKSLGHNMFWFRAKRDWSLGSDDVLAITFRNRSWTTQLMDL